MKLTDEGPFEFNGASVYARLWEDENDLMKPVVVVEAGRGMDLSSDRSRLAKDIAETLGTTPDQIQWFEQRRDGSLAEQRFTPFEYDHRPYAEDLSREDYTKAEKQGHLKPDVYTYYIPSARQVTPEERGKLEARLNDKLESYDQRHPPIEATVNTQTESFEQRQNREFLEMSFNQDRSM